MVSTGSRHLSMTACSRILLSQEPRGMSSRCSPRGVISSRRISGVVNCAMLAARLLENSRYTCPALRFRSVSA